MKVYSNLFSQIASAENLFSEWDKFKKGKRNKADVMVFERSLEQNIFTIRRRLVQKKYIHSPYTSFYIQDPKQRHIHKATVEDRIVHHAVYSVLNNIFEPSFISHSFSCRIGKGTHKGVLALHTFIRQASKNFTKPCFVLKCDIKSFFESIDHDILFCILKKKIKDEDTLWLLEKIIESHASPRLSLFTNKGLPIGNLTSQLFCNVYLNEFDQYIKHTLKVHRYARYTDDFVIVSNDQETLQQLVPKITTFLQDKLALSLHPKKVAICKFKGGIDFLGVVNFGQYRVLRSKTRKRMFRKLSLGAREYQEGKKSQEKLEQTLRSYLGILTHTHSHKLRQRVLNDYWFLTKKD